MSRSFLYFLIGIGYLFLFLSQASSATLSLFPHVGDPSELNVPVAKAPIPLLIQSQSGDSDQDIFVQKLRKTGKNKRKLFAWYLPKIGVNGILAGIHDVWPICHSEAHDLGKVIFAQVRKLHQSVDLCSGSCFGGCLHGVLIEALGYLKDASGTGLDFPTLKTVATKLCGENPTVLAAYSPGNCYHGVGHGLMAALNYEISQALQGCKVLGEVHREYYCVTGAFMEYVTEKDSQDADSKDFLYPCVEHAFPAACARYKMVHVARRHYKRGGTTRELQQLCQRFQGGMRIGCFHGLVMPMYRVLLRDVFSYLKSVLA